MFGGSRSFPTPDNRIAFVPRNSWKDRVEVEEREEAVAHVARLVRRDEITAAALSHISNALDEGSRLLLVHSDTLDGSTLNLALEERGISLPFRGGPVELIHDAGSREVLAAAAERTLQYEGGPLRVVCMTSPGALEGPSRYCLPVDGMEQLVEVECLFAVEQPTRDRISLMIRHDHAIIDGVRLPTADPIGRAAVLGHLLRSARRVETVQRLLAHEGFANLNSILLEQLERTHCERISQRMELASLRGQRTNERREMAATVGDRDRQLDIDAKILGTDGDVEELMALASSELGADLVLEDASFEALRSSGDPGPPSLRSLLPGRLTDIRHGLEPGIPALIRLGRPAAGSRLVMRLGADRRLGYLSVALSDARETDLQRAWLQRLRPSVTAARRAEVEVSAMIGRVSRHILREIASGGLSPIEARSAAGQLGWVKGKQSSLAVLSIDDVPGTQSAEDRLSTLCDRLNRGVFTAAVLDDEIVVLCPTAADVETLEGFVSELDGVAMGIGSFDDHPELASRAREQASWAARIARSALRTSVHFEEIGIHRLLLPGFEGGDPAFERPVRLLEERAASLTFDPLETLRAYLDAGASAREAAAQLNLHVNTLRYRIKRISALAEIDLADPERRFQADLAMRLRVARRAFSSEPLVALPTDLSD